MSKPQSNLSKLLAERDRLRKVLAEYPQTTDEQRKKEIMDLLHQYNEIKDGTQIIIGALANVENTTIKSLHERYNLPMDD